MSKSTNSQLDSLGHYRQNDGHAAVWKGVASLLCLTEVHDAGPVWFIAVCKERYPRCLKHLWNRALRKVRKCNCVRHSPLSLTFRPYAASKEYQCREQHQIPSALFHHCTTHLFTSELVHGVYQRGALRWNLLQGSLPAPRASWHDSSAGAILLKHPTRIGERTWMTCQLGGAESVSSFVTMVKSYPV